MEEEEMMEEGDYDMEEGMHPAEMEEGMHDDMEEGKLYEVDGELHLEIDEMTFKLVPTNG
jgi:hypothetical protein